MNTDNLASDFSETSMPMQDYIARILGYAAAGITLIIGTFIDYFSDNVMWAGLLALLYPHAIQLTTRSFSARHPYGTRQILIHGDAILCGLMLA